MAGFLNDGTQTDEELAIDLLSQRKKLTPRMVTEAENVSIQAAQVLVEVNSLLQRERLDLGDLVPITEVGPQGLKPIAPCTEVDLHKAKLAAVRNNMEILPVKEEYILLVPREYAERRFRRKLGPQSDAGVYPTRSGRPELSLTNLSSQKS